MGVEHEKKRANVSAKTKIAVIIIGVLIVISAIQAIELVEIKNTVKELSVKVAQYSSLTGKASDTLKKNIETLPGMVGGC